MIDQYPPTPRVGIAWFVRQRLWHDQSASIDRSRRHRMVFTPTALHSKAQGSRLRRVPWVHHAIRDPYPTGFTNPRCPRHQPSSITNAAMNDAPHPGYTTPNAIDNRGVYGMINRHPSTVRVGIEWFLRQRRYIPKPRVRGFAAYPGYTMPNAIHTPTGFYKPAMPASPNHHPLQTRP